MEQAGRRRRCLRGTARINSLPDALLHTILLKLGSVPAAARTSVLSRRWRHVWEQLPELRFLDPGHQLRSHSSFLNSVDGALARCSAPALQVLYIPMPYVASRVPAARVAAWLRVASRRVAGELWLLLPWHPEGGGDEEQEDLELPLCGRAKTIHLAVGYGFRQLRLPPAGAFAALTLMMIGQASIDARELEKVVCWQCPCLRELHLVRISLIAIADVTIRSVTLKRLGFEVENASRLVVDAPSIEDLILSKLSKVAVAAVKPAEVVPRRRGAGDPRRQLVGRHLGWLAVKGGHQVIPVLTRHFHTVNQLDLDLTVSLGEGYKAFLRAMNKLPKCGTLVVHLTEEWHAYEPSLLYLLRKSAGVRKLVVNLPWTECSPCMPGCTCGRKGSQKTDNIKLDSLEVVEINDFTEEDHHVNILRLLLSCKNNSARRIVVNICISNVLCSLSEGACKRIRDEARLSTDIRFHVWLHGRWQPYA